MLFFLKLSGHSFPSLFSSHLYPSLFPSLFHDLCFIHHHDHDCESCSVLSDSLWPHGLNSPWNSLGQNTRVSSLSHLQGIFPTQGLNPSLPHCRWILYQLSHKGNPRILEYVAYPFSSGSSLPRNWTGTSCIADRLFTNWAARDDHHHNGHHELSCYSSCLLLTSSRFLHF